MPASTTYAVFQYQKASDLVVFLNTGSSATPGSPVVQSKIVSLNYDSGNGQYYLILAPGY